MFKKFQGMMLSSVAAALMAIGGIGIGPNCWFIIYEPDLPKNLQRKGRA
ncbi:MAG: cyclic lactone autoinducer peptide [Bacillota bacterium]|jgi:cyclic lactone autoinducer peptide